MKMMKTKKMAKTIVEAAEKMRLMAKKGVTKVMGRRYYAIVVGERGSDRFDLTSHIHRTKAEALAHRHRIEMTRAYLYVETVSFRSRKAY